MNYGKDAASLAANRRVDIVIEGSRFEANAPLELVKAGGEPQTTSPPRAWCCAVRARDGVAHRALQADGRQARHGRGRRRREAQARHRLAGAARRCHARRSPSTKVAIQHRPGQTRRAHASMASRSIRSSFDGVDVNGRRHRGVEPLARGRPGRRRQPAWSRACSTRAATKSGAASAPCTSAAARCAPRSTRRLRS